jgi:hypothetical protein
MDAPPGVGYVRSWEDWQIVDCVIALAFERLLPRKANERWDNSQSGLQFRNTGSQFALPTILDVPFLPLYDKVLPTAVQESILQKRADRLDGPLQRWSSVFLIWQRYPAHKDFSQGYPFDRKDAEQRGRCWPPISGTLLRLHENASLVAEP